MTEMHKAIILSALDMKIASIKRARNSTGSQRFKEMYDLEEQETNDAKRWVQEQQIPKK